VAYKFHPHQKHKLDSEERRRSLPPLETLRRLGLREGEVAADVGCGVGYFTIPAAQIVGDKGWVYALDTSEEMLEELRGRLRQLGVRNVEPRRSEETNLGLPAGQVGFAFVSNVLHEVEGLPAFLAEVFQALGPGGRIAVIEWKKMPTAGGPPPEHRLGPEEIQGQLERAGFGGFARLEINSDLYGLTARKPA